MKRIVGIAVIAVLAGALLLVPNTYAQGNINIDTKVIPSEGKYDETLKYMINITKDNGYDIVDVYLTIGPDWRVPSINKTPSPCKWKKVSISSDDITTLSCNTSFRDIIYGEYRDWVLNGTDLEWPWAWYKVHARSLNCFPPLIPCEEGDDDGIGEPILIKTNITFYDSNVEYNKTGCPDKLLFDYDVEVWQNANNTIELQVFNYSTSEFESKGTENCTTLYAKHTLRWPGINLARNNFENLEGQYMFEVVRGQIEKSPAIYTGPEIREEFKNPNVTSQKGTSTFIYNVTVNANICDKIELQVFNYTKDDLGEYSWDSKGTRNYTKPLLTDQNLIWPDVNLSLDHNLREYKGKYRFVGCNISSDRGHVGPTIEERFHDPKVNYNKTINKLSFDYEVTAWVNMVEDNNITLEVKNFHIGEWEPKGTRSYTNVSNDQTIEWKNISLTCDNFDGIQGEYRFVGTYSESSPPDKGHIGPVIEEEFSDLSVTPKEGTNNKTFNYSVTVNANISDKIKLQVLNHTSKKWITKGRTEAYIIPDGPDKNQTLIWPNISLNPHELNSSNDGRYRFVGFCNRSISDEKEGPFWVANLTWDNISVEPERGLWNTKYKYCIRMRAERNLNVTLVVYKPTTEEEWPSKDAVYNKTKEYTDIYNWKTICWNITPFIEPFKKEKCVGYAGYNFTFKRKNESINGTKISKGPYVNIANFENATVEPKIETPEMTFTYGVCVNATEMGEVRIYWEDSSEEHSDDKSIGRYDTPNKEWCKRCNMTFEDYELGNITYQFKFENSKSIFSERYTGPELIEEKFSKLFVDPDKGTNTTWFNFNTSVSSTKKGNITVTLQVSPDEAAGEEDWINVTNKSYENVRPIIPINFNVSIDTNLSSPQKEDLASEWKKNKLIYWRVKGRFTNSTINSTKYHINLTWSNSSFSPPKVGWWNDSFTASVNLSANVNGTVELKVKCKNWRSVGNTSILNPLNWKNESICPGPYEGNTSYQFIFHCGDADYPNGEQDGPEVFIPLNMHPKNNTVEPEEGVYYNFTDRYFRDTTNPLFNYSIEVTADKPTTLKLVLTDPCGEKHNMTEECKYNTTTPHQPQECSWRMIELPSGQAGKWNYTFLYNDTRLYYDTGDGWNMSKKTFEGPEIIAVFENYTVDPDPYKFRDLVDVTVCVGGTKAMNVTLEAFNRWPHIKDWESIGRKHYEPSGVKCLNWTIDTFKVPFEELRLKLEE